MSTFIAEYRERDDKPPLHDPLAQLGSVLAAADTAIQHGTAVDPDLVEQVTPLAVTLGATLTTTGTNLESLRTQSEDRVSALATKKKELSELIAAGELSKSWSAIETQVRNAKEANRLKILVRPLPGLGRSVTSMAKSASDQLINQSFDKLFVEECSALRAPNLKVEFVGRQGKAQRRKVLSGKHKPSKILSEGEQKVLAMADFLAEARLAGITAPVIFDDPVSSLDHRRIHEVSQRIAALADNNQVIVFTHDIFFAITLLSLFEKSKRCTYFHVTDEDGKGEVTRATGPRWDNLANLKKNINETIQAAQNPQQTGMVPIVTAESRRQRWEDQADWPLTISAVLFLIAYAAPILQPDLASPLPAVCELVTWAAWGLFVVDYVARFALSRDRVPFVRGNLFDLAVVVLPLLRPLRLLRLITLLSVLNRNVGGSMRGRVAVYVAGATSLVLFIASLAVLDAERGAKGATITTFGDAAWWAFTTVTTVGYGDRYPITGLGRFIAGGLMLAGIALLGIVTASLASWLIDKVREVEELTQAATRADVVALTAEVHALRQELAEREPVG